MSRLSKWQKIASLLLLGLIALISTLQGFNNALEYSRDFQWSPSVLFWEGVNPYSYSLNGNENQRIILAQAPNYAHLTYLLLLPFTLLNWENAKFAWALTTLCFALIAVKILCKHAQLSFNETLVVLFVFLCSTPLRNTVGNGQHAVVVLLFFCGFFLKKNLSELLVGVGFFKYSFMPPVALYFAFSRGFLSAVSSSTACIIGWLLFSLYLDSNPLVTLIQPLMVSEGAVGLGTADIMTMTGFFFPSRELLLDRVLTHSTPLLLSLVFALFVTKSSGNKLYKFGILAIACLTTFKHLAYDFVLLLPVFIYAFKYRNQIQAKFAIGLIFFNWFGLRLIIPLKIAPEILVPINFASMLALAILITLISKTSSQ